MKRIIYSLLLCLVILFLSFTHSNAQENIIHNPSVEIETNHWPTDWQRVKKGNNVSVFTYKRDDGHESSKSLYINITHYVTGESAWYFNDVPVAPNSNYTYKEYYKSSIQTKLYLRVTKLSGIHEDIFLKDVAPSGDWSEIIANFNTPFDAEFITVLHKSSSVGFIQSDDFSLMLTGISQTPSPTPTPTVTPIISQNPTPTAIVIPPSPTPTISPTLTPSPSPTPTPTSNVNLIANPSVENVLNNTPSDWSRTKSGNSVAIFTHATTGYDQNRSLRINVTQYNTGFSNWYFSDVYVLPMSKYLYSEYYKSTMETEIFAKYTNINNQTSLVSLGNLPPSSNWVNFSSEITTPPDVKSMTVLHRASSLGNLYTDNFSLTFVDTQNYPSPTPSPSPTPTSIPTATPTQIPLPSATLTPPPTQDNPIPNPSLELVSQGNSNLPSNWSTAKTGTNNANFQYLTNGHSGTRSLRIDVTNYTSGVAYYRFDTADVIGGKTYEYSNYYKSDVYAEVDAEITLSNGQTIYQYLGVSYPSSEWSRFATQIRMPDNAVEVSIYNMIYSTGYLVTDDYSLDEVSVIPFNRAIVSLTFDDFFNSFYDTVFPMFQNYDYKGTVYLVTGDFNNPNILSADKIQEMHNYGFEVGSHTITHAHLPFISSIESEYELSQSKIDIQNFLGITPINFASPYGEYNDAVKEQIKQYYRSHRSVDVGFNSKYNFDKYNIKAQSAVVNTTPETVLEWVDQAIQDKTWLVIVYHDIVPNGGTFTNTPEHLQTVLDGLHQRGVAVMTVDAALNELLPQL